jgi:hypothetical protein
MPGRPSTAASMGASQAPVSSLIAASPPLCRLRPSARVARVYHRRDAVFGDRADDGNGLGEYHFGMRRARLRAEAAATLVAALFAVGPAGVASAGCSGFGPYDSSSCGSTDPAQSGGGSSWPPDTNSGSGWPPSINSSAGGGSPSSGGGSTHATPIVPVSTGP